MLYKASPTAAKQLIPIVEEIGHLSLGAIIGARLKSLGPKLKPKACTDTWWREIVTPARDHRQRARARGHAAHSREDLRQV